MTAGMAVVNTRGVWHTADVQEPGEAIFIETDLADPAAIRQSFLVWSELRLTTRGLGR